MSSARLVHLLRLAAASLAVLLAACGGGGGDDGGTKDAWSSLDRAAIAAQDGQMGSDAVIVRGDGANLAPGTILVYRTHGGLYGKLKLLYVDTDAHHTLHLQLVTYAADGSVLVSRDELLIRGTYTCDLEAGTEGGADFFWEIQTVDYFDIAPRPGAVFYVVPSAP